VMKCWSLLGAGLLLINLSACAPPSDTPPTPVTAATKANPAVVSAKTVLPAKRLSELPCALVESGPPQVIHYAAGSLYPPTAVLPSEAGLSCLEALAGWLKSGSGERWQVTVSGEEGSVFAAQALAEKRRELLERFFVRRGLAVQSWDWQYRTEPGAQLELRRATGLP